MINDCSARSEYMMNSMVRLLLLANVLLCTACKQDYPKVVIQTTLGDITAEIYVNQAPVTAGNFLSLVDAGVFNDGATFYRAVRDDNQPNNAVKIDVIQGGLRDSRAKLLTPIRHETTQETGLRHLNGSLSMARSAPGTADA